MLNKSKILQLNPDLEILQFFYVKYKNKLGLSWEKLNQSWELAKLVLSYITSVSNLDVFIFDVSFSAWVSWFWTCFWSLLILFAIVAWELEASFRWRHMYNWLEGRNLKKKISLNFIARILFLILLKEI